MSTFFSAKNLSIDIPIDKSNNIREDTDDGASSKSLSPNHGRDGSPNSARKKRSPSIRITHGLVANGSSRKSIRVNA